MKTSILIGILISGLILLNSCKPSVSVTDEHYLKGNELVLSNDLDEARKEFELAIKADSNNWKACYQLAGVFELQGDFKDSYFYFSKSIAINPKFTLGYFNRANLEEILGENKASDRDMKSVMDNKPFFMAQLSKARKEMNVGNFKEAIAYFDEAIKSRPDLYITYSMRGSCKYRMGDFAGAIKDFDNEVQLSPGSVMGLLNRSVAYSELKDFKSAMNDINAAINIDPTLAQAYIYKGVFCLKANMNDSACFNFNVAKKLNHPQADNYIQQYCSGKKASAPPVASGQNTGSKQ